MLNILYLEDSAVDVFFVRRALGEAGLAAEIHAVNSREEYAAAVESRRFDLILSDAGLPGFSGLEALALARQRSQGVPFIFFSGATDPNKVKTSLEAGGSAYVLKGQDWQLVSAIQNALALRASQQQIARLGGLNEAMARLVEAVQELSLARTLDDIMRIVRRTARQLTGADGATFVLRDGQMCHYAEEDAIAPLWKGQRFPMSACISGWTMLNRQAAIIEDIYADPRIPADAYRPTFVKSLVMVPIRTSAPIGAIGNYWAAPHLASTEEVELLQSLANTTAVSMEKVNLYAELEDRVKERTAQLKAANDELEAFSYSVSHDLAAPLRHIRSYLNFLREDCGAQLDQTAQEYIAKVQESAQHMTQLMQDLLRLSRVSRGELCLQKVDLSQMARDIALRLSAGASERQVDWQITDGIEAQADAGLLGVALENLLSNAWKYTIHCQQPRIEFGKIDRGSGVTEHFVRDNGAGFDMKSARDLFQPFKRLHSQAEFPGSGIGLATVRRIVERHGGRIWTEAAIGQGATFYFTLGSPQA